MVMDSNRKVVFDCPVAELNLADGIEGHTSNIVDSDTFWKRVELNMTIRGYPLRKVKPLEIQQNLHSWEPVHW